MYPPRALGVVVALATAFLLLLPPGSDAEVRTVIDFDAFADTAIVGAGPDVVAHGLHFDPPIQVFGCASAFVCGADDLARSPPNVAVPSPVDDFRRNRLVVHFRAPVLRVSVRVKNERSINPRFPIFLQLEALRSDGTRVDLQRLTLSADSEWLRMTVAGTDIRGVVLTEGPADASGLESNFVLIDDLEIVSEDEPPLVADDTAAPTVEIVAPATSFLVLPDHHFDAAVRVSDDRALATVHGGLDDASAAPVSRWTYCGEAGIGFCPGDGSAFEGTHLVAISDRRTDCDFNLRVDACDPSGNCDQASLPLRLGRAPGFTRAAVDIEDFDRCGAAAQRDFELALDLLESGLPGIVSGMPFYRKPRGRRINPRREERIRGRYLDELSDTRIVCRNDGTPLCSRAKGRGRPGRRLKLCYATMVADDDYTFCDLVGTLAHEMAHAGRVPRGPRPHTSSNGRDNVYRIHTAVERWCRQHCLERQLAGRTE